MFKVPYPCKDHGQAICIAVVNAQRVFYRATGLYHSSNSRIVGNFYAVREWKKRIARHHGAIQFKFERLRFVYGLVKRIHAACLSSATGNQLFVFGQNNGVRFCVLADF